MDLFTIGMWIVTLALLIISFIKDKQKSKAALQKAFLMGRGMICSMLGVIFAIGLVLTVFPPEQIAIFVGKQNVLLATVLSALFGTITVIPAFIAFPLVATLANAGVGIMPAVAFLTTLTMVGVATLPLEKRAFGWKFTVVRNTFSFVFAIIIALCMGVIL